MHKDALTCEFCGTVQSYSAQSCANCGAGLIGKEDKSQSKDVGEFQVLEQIHKHAGKSRMRLTALALSFAVLTGVFWQKARQPELLANQPAAQSLGADKTTSSEHERLVLDATTQARFADSMIMVSSLRMMLEMEMQETGEWPETFSQLGVSGADLNDGNNITSVELGSDSQIFVHLSNYFGDSAGIILSLRAVMAGTATKWSCVTNVKIPTTYTAGCTYKTKLSLNNRA